jgi:superfamily II DNA helicase RecQ
MPTGDGKSAVYQVAALARSGMTVVISPRGLKSLVDH